MKKGDGERINRIWYYIPNEEELQKNTSRSKKNIYKASKLLLTTSDNIHVKFFGHEGREMNEWEDPGP
ncbi:hypothetical protein OL548_24430 [Lysinibacillus sp. MHQ-1]|nr:hypothetical protein OL548_24430 [Lysinibacillus sp. MHQ-1]